MRTSHGSALNCPESRTSCGFSCNCTPTTPRRQSGLCIALCFGVHKISSMAARHSVCTARSQRCSLKWKSEKSWLCDIYSSFCGMVASNKLRMPLIIAIYDAASLMAALKAVADEGDPMAVSVNYKILYHRGDGWIDAGWAWSRFNAWKWGYVC